MLVRKSKKDNNTMTKPITCTLKLPEVRCFLRGSLLQVAKAASEMSAQINVKRKARGLKGRPVRACVIGFPNIGKSALINRLLKRRACDSAPRPGVTRSFKWIRVGGDLDLLDAPGFGAPPPFLFFVTSFQIPAKSKCGIIEFHI